MRIVSILVPYLIGAATTLIVQVVIQLYVVPRVETRKRREDRFERNVLELGELLTTEASQHAFSARLEQATFRAFRQRQHDPLVDQTKLARGIEEQGQKARQATWDFIGFVRTRIYWIAERIFNFASSDSLADFQIASMRYVLKAQKVAGWSPDDVSTDDAFEEAWDAEREARNELIEQAKLLANLPHPPRPTHFRWLRRWWRRATKALHPGKEDRPAVQPATQQNQPPHAGDD